MIVPATVAPSTMPDPGVAISPQPTSPRHVCRQQERSSGPQRSRKPYAVFAGSTAYVLHPSPTGAVNLTVLTIAALLAFLLVAIAVVIRGPLGNAIQDYRNKRTRDAVKRQQDNDRLALEQAVAANLSATTPALKRLAASAQSLDSQVQAAIGMSLSDAIAHPPTPVRRAFLSSSSFRAAWTELANAAVSPARLNDLAAVPAAVAARLSAHTVRESDRQELAQVIAAVQSLQAQIDFVDLAFLYANKPLDNQRPVTTIHTTERR